MALSLVAFSPEQHYEELCRWWREQNWPCVPLSHLPSGWVVLSDGKPACAGFVYFTGTAFCLFEWVTANPEVRHAERTASLDYLFECVRAIVKEAEVKTIFMSVRHAGLMARLEKHGFKITDQRMTNMTAEV
jgi:hypothetical protein